MLIVILAVLISSNVCHLAIAIVGTCFHKPCNRLVGMDTHQSYLGDHHYLMERRFGYNRVTSLVPRPSYEKVGGSGHETTELLGICRCGLCSFNLYPYMQTSTL